MLWFLSLWFGCWFLGLLLIVICGYFEEDGLVVILGCIVFWFCCLPMFVLPGVLLISQVRSFRDFGGLGDFVVYW